jgi:hypothetical protein
MDSIRNTQIGAWMDNYYKRRFGVNPGMTDLSTNATVLAVVKLPRLGRFRGHAGLKDIMRRVWATSVAATAADHSLRTFVSMCAAEHRDRLDIRVPLDVPRDDRERPPWRTLTMEDEQCGSQVGLLRLLDVIHEVRTQSAGQLPLLVDENIYHRLQKLMYAPQFAHVDVRGGLKDIIPVYGVWHAYKAVCEQMQHTFFSLFTYFETGRLREGVNVPCHRKLAYIERMMAAVWIVGSELLPQLITSFQDTYASWRVTTRSSDSQVRSSRAGVVTEGDIIRVLALGSEQTRMPGRLVDMWMLIMLITQFCPAVFAVGVKVRDCNWEGMSIGTAAAAEEATQWALAIILRLDPSVLRRLKYRKTLSIALLQWTPWMRACPGAMASEEFCEALLSQVTRRMRQHPTLHSHADYWNIFVTTTLRTQKVSKNAYVSPKVIALVRQRMKTFMHGRFQFPNVRWTNARVAKVAESLSRKMPCRLKTLAARVPRRDFEAELKLALRSLISKTKISPEVMSALLSAFPQRDAAATAAELAVVAELQAPSYLAVAVVPDADDLAAAQFRRLRRGGRGR